MNLHLIISRFQNYNKFLDMPAQFARRRGENSGGNASGITARQESAGPAENRPRLAAILNIRGKNFAGGPEARLLAEELAPEVSQN